MDAATAEEAIADRRSREKGGGCAEKIEIWNIGRVGTQTEPGHDREKKKRAWHAKRAACWKEEAGSFVPPTHLHGVEGVKMGHMTTGFMGEGWWCSGQRKSMRQYV